MDLPRDQGQDASVSVQTYCLMSHHVHLIVTPEQGDSLAVRFRRVHGRYAQYFNARYRRSGHLWPGRFFSCPLSPDHWEAALRYVEYNRAPRRVVTQRVGDPHQEFVGYAWEASERLSLVTGSVEAS